MYVILAQVVRGLFRDFVTCIGFMRVSGSTQTETKLL